jgi:Rrf2 family transcriptional regulator, nitric oxide-sensitive transcriptional repressor
VQLTLQTDYGLRMLLYLALRQEDGGTIPQISRAYGISENHLRKVANHMVGAGLLKSTRGRGGGLRLARLPSEISIGDVIRKVETHFNLVECIGPDPKRCAVTGYCGLEGIIDEALAAWFAVLDRYTLADAITQPHTLTSLLGFAPTNVALV